MTGRLAGVLSPIPDHDATVCAHGRDDIRILRLVAGLVNLTLVIDLLYNVELHFYRWRFFACSFTVATDLLAFFIVIGSVRSDGLRELHVSNL